MNKNIMMLGIGAVSGAATTAALGYFCIIRKYIPMRELESEIDKLRDEKQKLYRQVDKAKGYADLMKSHMDRKQLEKELDILEKEAKSRSEEVSKFEEITEHLDYQHPEKYVNEKTDDSDISEESEGYDIIDDGIPRIDGILTKDEQSRLDECGNDEDLQRTVLTSIKEERWRRSINPRRSRYQISSKEHENLPEFFDTIDLDYYRGDDILAEGVNIVDKDRLIDPAILNSFGKRSQTNDPNVVICRNDKLEADYMITLDDRCFQEVIFGVNADKTWKPEKSDDNENTKE